MERDGDKENYFILYERYKKVVTQQSSIVEKYEETVVTAKTLREEEMLTRMKAEVLHNDNLSLQANLEQNNMKLVATLKETEIYRGNAANY